MYYIRVCIMFNDILYKHPKIIALMYMRCRTRRVHRGPRRPRLKDNPSGKVKVEIRALPPFPDGLRSRAHVVPGRAHSRRMSPAYLFSFQIKVGKETVLCGVIRRVQLPEALAMEVFPTMAESSTQHNHGLRIRPRFEPDPHAA